ncbi:cupin domain-containing protein [Pedobacter arcticus]|uniref:cupin domain-containing protein n=1 Tax=Pedobacter arcticus TaxID=752140 RepID=UPI000316CEDD|nr:cupin domain-containing protein [Pedobacter arcticus]
MQKDAQYYVNKLSLIAHPEGGFYAETYRSKNIIQNSDGNQRNISTAIYFLLSDTQKSHFHRIKSDELWFHHDGETLAITVIVDGKIEVIHLGKDLEKGEVLQAIIPANCWFASEVKNKKGFVLVSCTVAPGFDFTDFEMAKKADLVIQYPAYAGLFEELCFA